MTSAMTTTKNKAAPLRFDWGFWDVKADQANGKWAPWNKLAVYRGETGCGGQPTSATRTDDLRKQRITP